MSPTIAQQRHGENAQGLVVRRRSQWGARRAYTDARAVDDAIRLFFHITVTNPGNYLNNDRHAQGIEAIGIARFPNTGISYNMLVMPDASIYEAQPLGRRGAHTVNDFKRSSCTTTGCPSRGQALTARSWNLNYNARAVAICQNTQHPVTAAQARAVARIGAAWKRAGFMHRQARWHGHRCVSSKSCPGNAGWARMQMIHDLTESYTVNGLPGTTSPPPPPDEDWFDMATKKDLEDVIDAKVPRAVWWQLLTNPIPGATDPLYTGTYLRFAWRGAARAYTMLPKLEEMLVAIASGIQGLDTAAILQQINAHHAEVIEVAKAAEADREQILELLEQNASGAVDAQAVVDGIRDLVHQATAPPPE